MRYRGYLFDLDGTLYRGNEAIPGARDKVQELACAGAVVGYVTNNSTLTPAEFAKKLAGMGFPVEADQVMSSAVGAARYLAEQNLRRVFVIGEDGLRTVIREHGGSVLDENHGAADAVVVGLCRTFTYAMMRDAMHQIRGGARFVATNPDVTLPTEGGMDPGAGSIVAAVQACTGVDPTVIGKPEPYLLLAAMAEAGLKPEETLVVGDRLGTDIAAGRACGCPTFLVLTGVETAIPEGQAGGKDLRELP